MEDDKQIDAVELATELTIAWLGNQHNRITADEVPTFLRQMHSTLSELAGGAGGNSVSTDAEPSEQYTPATTPRKSLSNPEHILSMIDGKPYKSLKRHLSANGLTPAEYRERYNLKADYPMTAPAYSERRREVAKKLGLGRKPKTAAPSEADAAPSAKPRRGRKAAASETA